MQPYYQDDFATLYCGDTYEILDALKPQADFLFADPPYNVKKNTVIFMMTIRIPFTQPRCKRFSISGAQTHRIAWRFLLGTSARKCSGQCCQTRA